MNDLIMHELDLALDISTATTGLCVLEHNTGNLVLLDSIKLNKVQYVDIWDKIEKVNLYFAVDLHMKLNAIYKDHMEEPWLIKKIYVEEAPKMFMPGKSSAGTLMLLARFNALVSYSAFKVFGIKPTDINVRSARKALGIKVDQSDKSKSTKEKVREEVIKLYPSLPLTKHLAKTGKMKGQMIYDKECEDMLDSFVVGAGARLLHK
jgi:hypothetical protein